MPRGYGAEPHGTAWRWPAAWATACQRTYEPVALLAPGLLEPPAPLEPELPMWVQLCLPDWPAMGPAWPVPVEADEDGAVEADALGDAEDEVVDVVNVVAVAPAPPADASATPVAPAPTPAAMTPVMISRRARLPTLETIGFLPSRRSAARRGWLAFEGQPVSSA